MKKYLLYIIISCIISVNLYSQAPKSFKYQAVVRNSSGLIIQNQNVSFRINLLSGSTTGTSVYEETHNVQTNEFGIVNINIGEGTVTSGNFNNINWGSNSYFVQTEFDEAGGANYQLMGVSQLLSVPYALYSEKSGSADSSLWKESGNNIYYNQGNVGIGSITPTGKLVVKSDSTATVDDVIFSVLNAQGDTILAVYQEGVRINVYDNPVAKATTSKGGFAVGGFSPSKGAFTNEYFRVTPDSVRIYIEESSVAKANTSKGGFAVGGFSPSKLGLTNEYLRVTNDSTRIWTEDTIAGFGVSNIEATTSTSYMHINPSNYFIGHYSGTNITNGLYNSAFGYKADSALTSGSANIAIGYKAGLHNSSGNENVFIGYQSGLSNTTGERNLFLGMESGKSNIDGIYNLFLGYQSGFTNISGGHNSFIGYQAGYHNTTGWTNMFIGSFSGYDNTTGTQNVFLGGSTGASNTTGFNNVYIGHRSGLNNVTGARNIFIGFESGLSETGSDKLFIENSSTTTSPLIQGDFVNDRIAFHRMATLYPLQVGWSAANGNGAYLSAGGTWTNTSSKSLKDRFIDLNKSDLLNKIENLDIQGWYYKETQEYHIGPYAEDFYNAFGTGVLNEPNYLGKSLAASDVAGVSLFAVKELIKQNQELQNQIDALKNSNDSLKASIEKINKLLEISAKK